MKRQMNKLWNAQRKYDAEVRDVEKFIADKVEFDFYILYQESDGWVMLALDARNAPMDTVLDVIKQKGVLTKEDYLNCTI